MLLIIVFSTSTAWGFSSRRPNQTEGGFCYNCGPQGLSPIALGQAGGPAGSLDDAIKKFKEASEKYGKECLNKSPILITDLSRGSDNNMTYILERTANGGYVQRDSFQTGQGKGVGNAPGSNFSPTGLMRLRGNHMYAGRMEGGRHYTWPIFTNSRGQRFNYIGTSGLEPRNRNISSRSTVFHAITYDTGNTTKGCTGIPKDKFFLWADALSDTCAYNYSPTTP